MDFDRWSARYAEMVARDEREAAERLADLQNEIKDNGEEIRRLEKRQRAERRYLTLDDADRLEALKDRNRSAHEDLKDWEERIDLATRLFGGFRSDEALLYAPPDWRRGALPSNALDFEREIAAHIDPRQLSIFQWGNQCPYFSLRREIFEVGSHINRMAEHAQAAREFPVRLETIAAAAAGVYDHLEELAKALDKISGYHIPDGSRHVSVSTPTAVAAMTRRRLKDHEKHLWGGEVAAYSRTQIFDRRQIEQFQLWCGALMDEAQTIAAGLDKKQGNPTDFKKNLFAAFAGLAWLWLTRKALTQYENHPFKSFLQALEAFYWGDSHYRDVTDAGNKVARSFKGWQLPLDPLRTGEEADFRRIRDDVFWRLVEGN